MSSPEALRDLLEEMAKYGLYPPNIKWDTSKIQRFSYGDGKKNDRGWYKAFSDDPLSAAFGCHGLVDTVTWSYKGGPQPDNVDLSELKKAARAKKKRENAELEEEFAAAAARCETEWRGAPAAKPKHPYIIKKGMDGKGLRQKGNRLLVPMKNVGTGKFMSLQYIDMKGEKRFATGTKGKGAKTVIGQRAFTKSQLLYLVEGYATGYAINKVTGMTCVVCFSASNLLPVAKSLRKKFPKARIIIAADNDRWEEPGVNPGVEHAKKAAEEAHAQVAIPHFGKKWDKDKPTDFNDLYLLEDADQVKHWLDPENARQATISTGEPDPPEPEADELPPKPPSHSGAAGSHSVEAATKRSKATRAIDLAVKSDAEFGPTGELFSNLLLCLRLSGRRYAVDHFGYTKRTGRCGRDWPHDGRLDVRLRVVQHRPTWGAKHAGQWAATLRTYAYPKIGEKRVDWITTADVMGVLLPLWQLLRAP